MVKVLFICMGNICRSPTAHGVFSRLVKEHGLSNEIIVDSAGTHAYHVGSPPDKRAQMAAAKRQVDLSGLTARQVVHEDFEQFDYVLAMDSDNLDILTALCPGGMDGELRLFLDFAPDIPVQEVPDPYYGGSKGFERVLDLVESAANGLLTHIREQHLAERI